VKTVDDYRRMKSETGCDAVMVGPRCPRQSLAVPAIHAIETGAALPSLPAIAEQRPCGVATPDLVVEYASDQMCLHELRKTLAWYSRGLYGGAYLCAVGLLRGPTSERHRILARAFCHPGGA